MAQATDAQVQTFCDEQLRPLAERFLSVIAASQFARSSIDDVYDRCANGPAWADNRTTPPHLLDQSDPLNANTFLADFLTFIDNNANVQKFLDAAVNGPRF